MIVGDVCGETFAKIDFYYIQLLGFKTLKDKCNTFATWALTTFKTVNLHSVDAVF